MFYEMAKRYDEWPGEDYDGSSARGAMKGWHKHGVCATSCWEYDDARQKADGVRGAVDRRRAPAARRVLPREPHRPGRDAQRDRRGRRAVRHRQRARRVGRVGRDGLITQSATITGGHAFAIVAYDERGFWIQNSWAADWGFHGFGHITYDDWLANATDTWVARLGAPVVSPIL